MAFGLRGKPRMRGWVMCFIGLWASGWWTIQSARAQDRADREELRHRTRLQDREMLRQQEAPDVRLEPGLIPGDALHRAEDFTLAPESPCFEIKSIRLAVPEDLPESIREQGKSARPSDPFYRAQAYLNKYAGQCIGKAGINTITRRLTSRILDKGYCTTRVGIPEQDLSKGELKIMLVPGVIRAIRFADENTSGSWKTAFPTRPGDLLNLRDLEQGLEQMKRVPSQDIDMQIVPGELPGESDVIISVKRSKPWKVSLYADDSGSNSTGKLQAGLNFSADNPLKLNDLFNIGFSTDGDRNNSQKGTRGRNVYYSIPCGYWTFILAGNEYDYHQKIAGLYQSFISSGNSETLEIKVQRLLYRDQTKKSSVQFRLGRRWSKSFIDDTEIEVQRRDVTSAEIALMHRQYFKAAQIDGILAYRKGVPWFGGQQDAQDRPSDSPTLSYGLQTLDISILFPFKIAEQPVRWLGRFRGQTTQSPLYGSELFSIGNRYTVRGFDGEQVLAAEKGWFLRDELEFPLAGTGQALYAGMDHGQVEGPATENLAGTALTGAVIGLRGGAWGGTYDFFAGWALQKPEGFKTAQPAMGFQATYQF